MLKIPLKTSDSKSTRPQSSISSYLNEFEFFLSGKPKNVGISNLIKTMSTPQNRHMQQNIRMASQLQAKIPDFVPEKPIYGRKKRNLSQQDSTSIQEPDIEIKFKSPRRLIRLSKKVTRNKSVPKKSIIPVLKKQVTHITSQQTFDQMESYKYLHDIYNK